MSIKSTQRIWFIRRETDYGPFFSSVEKARAYLSNPDNRPTDCDDIEEMLSGRNPYVNVIEVTLDDESVGFDE